MRSSKELGEAPFPVGEKIAIQPGTPEMGALFAQLVLYSSPQLMPYLFRPSPAQFLAILYGKPDNIYSYRFTDFAWRGSAPIGVILRYTAAEEREVYLGTAWRFLQHFRGALLLRLPELLKANASVGKLREDEVFVSNIAVSPRCRGKGAGRALLLAAEKYAAACEKRALGLYVEAWNKRAMALYQRMGYRIVQAVPLFTLGSVPYRFYRMRKRISWEGL